MNEREVQFHAALLECGNVSSLATLLAPGCNRLTDFDSRPSCLRRLFPKHKEALLEHLVRADYFDVYYTVGGDAVAPDVKTAEFEVLTPKAANWIGEFYQWLLKQQDLHSV